MSTKRSRRLFSLLIASAVVASSCGGKDSGSSASSRQRNVALTNSEYNNRRTPRFISAAGESMLAISNENRIVQWGQVWDSDAGNFRGDINIPLTSARVAASSVYASVAITLDNKFVAWGDNTDDLEKVPSDLDLSTVVSLSTDGVTVYAIDMNGKLWGWGNVYDFDPEAQIPAEVASLKIVEVATDSGNNSATIALDENGKVHVWGRNPDISNSQTDFAGITAKHVSFIYGNFTVVTTDGKVIQSGYEPRSNLFNGINVDRVAADGFGNFLASDSSGQLHLEKSSLLGLSAELVDSLEAGVNDFNEYSSGTALADLQSGWGFFVVLEESGSFTYISGTWPDATTTPAYFGWKSVVNSVSASNWSSYAVNDDYTIKAFHSLEGETAPPTDANYVAVAAGWNHTLTLRTDGSVVSWGSGPNDNAIPQFEGQPRQIGAGHGFSAVRTTYGDIYDWGNFYSPSQTTVARPNDCAWYEQMDVGFANVIALGYQCDNDERLLHIWGDNSYGQADIPADLDLNEIWKVAITVDCAAALMYDGTIRVWGECYGGIKDVPADFVYRSLDLGFGFGVAIGSTQADNFETDQVVVWGEGADKELAPPPNALNIMSVAAGRSHILAIDYEGNVFAWGSDVRGETKVPSALRTYTLPEDTTPPKKGDVPEESDMRKRLEDASGSSAPSYPALGELSITRIEDGQIVNSPVSAPAPETVVLPESSKTSTLAVVPAASSPGLKVGSTVSPAQASKILGLTKVAKVSFSISKKLLAVSSKVCKVTKTSVSLVGPGICDVKVTYTDSKKKTRTKALALIISG